MVSITTIGAQSVSVGIEQIKEKDQKNAKKKK